MRTSREHVDYLRSVRMPEGNLKSLQPDTALSSKKGSPPPPRNPVAPTCTPTSSASGGGSIMGLIIVALVIALGIVGLVASRAHGNEIAPIPTSMPVTAPVNGFSPASAAWSFPTRLDPSVQQTRAIPSVSDDFGANDVTQLVVMAVAILVGLGTIWATYVHRQLKDSETRLIRFLTRATIVGRPRSPTPVPSEIGSAASTPTFLRLSPPDLIRRLCEDASGIIGLRYKPAIINKAWTLGFATCTGNVRSRNEDYVIAFSIIRGRNRLHEVVIIADGVGGRPHGDRAAYSACLAAASLIILQLGSDGINTGPERQAAAEAAIFAAAEGVKRVADRLGITSEEDGLQTTCIVVIAPAGSGEVGFAHIGDGLGVQLKTNGEPHHFVVPQKADPAQPNILGACLGPTALGKPRSGHFPREDGDLILVGTDGVADRVTADFPAQFIERLNYCSGSVTIACSTVLDEMADITDSHGYVFDDNMTLAAIGGYECAQCHAAAVQPDAMV